MTLVRITEEAFDVQLYIAYAMSDNFTGVPMYKNPYCYLHEDAVTALKKTITLARAIGLRVKIFDAFRPLEVQRMLWDKYPDPEFISNPDTGRTPHCRGIAVDMTLIDMQGNELDMGTAFDAFTPLSHHANTNVSQEAQRNRHVLMGIMAASGWQFNPKEWWHYQLPHPESYTKYTDMEAKTYMMA